MKTLAPPKNSNYRPTRREGVVRNLPRLTHLLVALVPLFLVSVSQAQIHINIPEDRQPPFYANFDRGFMPHTDEWAVVIFYRSPGCVPPNFNLLDRFDFTPAFPGGPPRPFLCDLHIEGRTNWVSLDDPYPADAHYQGTGAVPLWFVRWPELQAAVADDELTIAELAALPSLLIGSASFYHESIRNDIRGQRGGNEALIASGTLMDDREFQVEITEEFREGTHIFPHVRIEFR